MEGGRKGSLVVMMGGGGFCRLCCHYNKAYVLARGTSKLGTAWAGAMACHRWMIRSCRSG